MAIDLLWLRNRLFQISGGDPKEIRKKLHLRSGQKLHILELGGRIEFILQKKKKNAGGSLKSIDTLIES